MTCPGCEHMLTIPTTADGVSPLGVSKAKYNRANAKVNEREVLRHHRQLSEGEHHEWADAKLEDRDNGLKIMIPIALFSLLLIGGLAYLLLSEDDTKPKIGATTAPAVADNPNNDSSVAGKAEGNSAADDIYIYNTKDKEQVAQLEEFLTGLFAAKTVDEMLPYVRPTDNIKEKMIKFYKGESLSHSPFKKLTQAQNTPNYPGYLTFSSQNQDYSNQTGVLKYSKDEILLDWESFVAYSDMTWAELAEKKPTEPVRVRVSAKRAFYYNDQFTDETKWQAVSLISPNEEDPIYGYVQKNSATAQRLFNFGNSDNLRLILDVYFPEDASKGDQVFIDSVVELGWVIKDKEE